MTTLTWGNPGDKTYETGLDRGVFYPTIAGWSGYEEGVAWNGLVSMTENVSGGEVESYYYDGNKYLDWILYEDFQATLEAFSTPPEFAEADGMRQLAIGLFVSQQLRKQFGMSWRTQVGNDLTENAGYKLNILWGCTAAPSEKVSTTLSGDNTLPTRAWTIYTTPPQPGSYGGVSYRPTARMIIDSRFAPPNLGTLEQGLYGDTINNSRLPSQQEVLTVMNTGFWS